MERICGAGGQHQLLSLMPSGKYSPPTKEDFAKTKGNAHQCFSGMWQFGAVSSYSYTLCSHCCHEIQFLPFLFPPLPPFSQAGHFPDLISYYYSSYRYFAGARVGRSTRLEPEFDTSELLHSLVCAVFLGQGRWKEREEERGRGC